LSEAKPTGEFKVEYSEIRNAVIIWVVLAIIVGAVMIGIQVAEGYTVDPGVPALVILIIVILLGLLAAKGVSYSWSSATWK